MSPSLNLQPSPRPIKTQCNDVATPMILDNHQHSIEFTPRRLHTRSRNIFRVIERKGLNTNVNAIFAFLKNVYAFAKKKNQIQFSLHNYVLHD